MKVLRLIATVAVANAAAFTTFEALARVADDSELSTHHSHPISRNLTVQYLNEYLGSTVYNSNDNTQWFFGATKIDGKIVPDAPSATQPGDVIFVEVNDYWKGTQWYGTPSLYNQVMYGVKSINKVGQGTQIGNGAIYHYKATTSRFFFAVRTSDFYVKQGNHTDGTSDDSKWVEYNTDVYYLEDIVNTNTGEEVRRVKPFRWYNEFSAVKEEDRSKGWGALSGAFDELKNGDFKEVPHSCSNSLEVNHFTTLNDPNVVDEPYSAEVMLFVPAGTNAAVNSKNTNYSTGNIPQVFFYVNSLEGSRVQASTSSKYAINLNWQTSFDKASGNGITFTPWNGTKGGVKEESHVYRKIEGSQSFTEVYIEDGLVNLKQWTDKELPLKAAGYDVEYYVITKVITYDARGERTGEEIATAPTNHVTFHIPGTGEYFGLELSNNFTSKFSPVAGNMGRSYNKIENVVIAKTNELTPALSEVKKGDRFKLTRQQETGNQDVRTLEITGITTSGGLLGFGKKTTYSYKINNGTVQSSTTWTTVQDILDVLLGANGYAETLNYVPGNIYDAKYQLVYTDSYNDSHYSNVVSARSLRTDVEVEKAYRSGTPDPEKNAAQELYTATVRFKPIISDNVAYYNIWRNAEEKVVRIGQSGTSFAIIGKDDQGNFNVDLGAIAPDDDGYINVAIDHAMEKHVCEFETGNGLALDDDDLFFTVEVCATGSNSYGNRDRASDFVGDPSELVLNSYGVFYEGNSSIPGEYAAEIYWDKIKNKDNLGASDYVAEEPDYYTVHRCRLSGNGEVAYEPITEYWRGHNDLFDSEGNLIEKGKYTLVDKTTDGSAYRFTPEVIQQALAETGEDHFCVVDFITDKSFVADGISVFPAVYYVKAHYDSQFKTEDNEWIAADYNAIQNFVEKNSNPARATATIVTGVNEKIDSEVVSTIYYDLMGYPVAKPARGQIVVAQYRHANGKTSARVIRF